LGDVRVMAMIKQLKAERVTSDNFWPYGQVIAATPDGKPYDQDDAQLQLRNGIPRLYIMQLQHRGRRFHKITRHLQCTQCLGSLSGSWLIAVAPPNVSCQPEIEKILAFQIPGNCFIKLNRGTWHAGPYFDEDFMDFYNLELSDTNVNDHDTYNLLESHSLELEVAPLFSVKRCAVLAEVGEL